MAEPIATTKQGQVRGVEKLGCLQFRGIPFAAPPVGELRWKSPQPAAPWDGTRDASEFGPTCPQVAGTMEALSGGARPQPDPMSEDCLTLNVWTPAIDGEPRPVMVWIHGGAFATGSGRIPWYSGHNFARDGVVLVTINYRLNAFGFLELGELFDGLRGSGSVGIADQVAALRWVRDNIANFGGDPSNVTIFGESAGGMSVGTLLGTPSAKGLFTKAIPQSGAAHATLTVDVATRIANRFCEVANVAPGDLDALYALSTQDIVETVTKLSAATAPDNDEIFGRDFAGMVMASQPVIGTELIPRSPIEAIRDGAAKDVPVLIGTTLEEWKLFTLMTPPEALRQRAIRPLRNLCEQAGKSVDELVGAHEAKVGDNELDLRVALETERVFRIPAIRLAEAQAAQGAPVWMYRFDWKTPAFDGKMGACHALEIPFVFDNLDAPGVGVFTGGAAPQSLATTTHDAWVSFAKSGSPGWDGYDTSRRATMLLDTESRVVDDPDGDLRRAWEGLL